MFAQFYENIVLKNPKSIFAILLIALISFGYYSKDFRLDASSETLLIEGDPDLKYLQEISKKYGSKEPDPFCVYGAVGAVRAPPKINRLF